MEAIAWTIAAIALGLVVWGMWKTAIEDDIPGVDEKRTYGGRYYHNNNNNNKKGDN